MKKKLLILLGATVLSTVASANNQYHLFDTTPVKIKPIANDAVIVSKSDSHIINHPVIDATGVPWSFDRVREPEILPIIPEAPHFTVQKKVVEELVVTDYTLSADLLFAFDRFDIKPKDVKFLAEVVQHINENYHELQQVVVVGHTDRLGSDAYNKDLSEKRANTVKSVLSQHGISPMLITTFGAGEKEPVTDGCPNVTPRSALKECLQPDRRVTIQVIGKTAKVEKSVQKVIE